MHSQALNVVAKLLSDSHLTDVVSLAVPPPQQEDKEGDDGKGDTDDVEGDGDQDLDNDNAPEVTVADVTQWLTGDGKTLMDTLVASISGGSLEPMPKKLCNRWQEIMDKCKELHATFQDATTAAFDAAITMASGGEEDSEDKDSNFAEEVRIMTNLWMTLVTLQSLVPQWGKPASPWCHSVVDLAKAAVPHQDEPSCMSTICRICRDIAAVPEPSGMDESIMQKARGLRTRVQEKALQQMRQGAQDDLGDFATHLVANKCRDASGQLLFLPEGVQLDKLMAGNKSTDEATFTALTQMSASQPVGKHKIFTYTDTLQAVTAGSVAEEEDVALVGVIQGLCKLNECQRMASAAALVEFHDVPSCPLTELKQGNMPVSYLKQLAATQAAVEAAKGYVARWASGSAKVKVPDQLNRVITRFTWLVERADVFVASRKTLLAELVSTIIADTVAEAEKCVPKNWRGIVGKSASELNEGLAKELILGSPSLVNNAYVASVQVLQKWKTQLTLTCGEEIGIQLQMRKLRIQAWVVESGCCDLQH